MQIKDKIIRDESKSRNPQLKSISEEEVKSSKSKSSIYLTTIATFAGFLGGAIAFGVSYFFLPSLLTKNEKNREDRPRIFDENKHLSKDGIYYIHPSKIIINLGGNGKERAYISLDISYAVKGEANLAAFENIKPKIDETAQIYLSTLKQNDLNGAVDLYKIKSELLIRCNTLLAPNYLNDVLITNLIVQ